MSPNVELFDNDSLPLKINEIRIIPYMILPGRQNMAIDHYFASNKYSDSQVLIRFYGWQPECVSLGHHQKSNIINRSAIHLNNIDLVRRPTGGSAVFHSDELTYSIIVSKNIINHQILYSTIHNVIAISLNNMGYNVYLENSINKKKTQICYNRAAKSEIKYNNKKLVGSAQRIYPDTILQHGSILFSNKQIQIVDYLKLNKEEIDYNKNILQDNSISLKEIIRNNSINKYYLIANIVEQFKISIKGIFYFKNLTKIEYRDIKAFEKLFVIE